MVSCSKDQCQEDRGSLFSRVMPRLLGDACRRPLICVSLRILSVLLAISANIHFENKAGHREVHWADALLDQKIEDVVDASLDTAPVPSLWLERPAGLACFPRAAWSQLIPTSDFRDGFVLTEEFHSAVLVILHIAVLARFFVLLLTKKE